ncbi:hypothetical protein E1B28_003141 [Marasmius oreades]|uniref:Cytochrome P450 n=1 Tax=Marasmius oreades TaxID=181124 RepID=A0A9P7RLA5_9AGAR|nr:uncharacterized protein E1B28_003141 [Marasmius oreades]KAG7085590.1 hypothetical protein E1B28_003141 [Marasmius oreades]
MLNDLVRWKWLFSFMRYSDWWRLHRKTVHQSFNHPQVLPEYYDIQKERTSLLIRKLATSPKDFFEHVRAHSGEIVLEIVYGYRTQEDIDMYIKLVDGAMEGLNASGVYGTYLVDYFPILKHVPAWFPGARFKTEAEMWARNTDRAVNLPWELIKKLIDEGSAVPCFCTRNLEKIRKTATSNDNLVMDEVIKNCAATSFLGKCPFDQDEGSAVPCFCTRNLEKFRKSATSNNNLATDEVIKNCAATSFLGGAETTVSAVLSFILAMVLNPRIQARAQKELDEITGSARLPEFADRENLPYIHAILLETLRWNPVLPLGSSAIPHRSVNDDVYEGYLIPGGSAIIANAWAVLRNESLYGPDTANFNPDRFIKQDGKSLPPNPESIAFGFGRQSCPGRQFALNSVWLTITYLLASFTIAKEIDNEGKEINPVVEYMVGLTRFVSCFRMGRNC